MQRSGTTPEPPAQRQRRRLGRLARLPDEVAADRAAVSAGSAWNCAQVHDFSVAPPRVSENVQSASGVRGVGPADSTGKSVVTCWPGGTRPAFPAEADGR